MRWLQRSFFLAGYAHFFPRITEAHEGSPQRSERWKTSHGGTVVDRGNGPKSHLPWGCFMFCCMCEWTSECTWKKWICSYLSGTVRMLQWVTAWIETDSLSFSWDLNCVLLLLCTGSILIEEKFNRTPLSSSWGNTDPPRKRNKMSQVWLSVKHPIFSASAYLTEKLPAIAVKCAVLCLAESVAATLCKHTLPRQQLQ